MPPRMLFVALLLGLAPLAQAATNIYQDRQQFQAQLGISLTDDYESPGYGTGDTSILTDADMSAVIGQTRYITTLQYDYNVVFQSTLAADTTRAYCSACNGTFDLDFRGTSYGDPKGVFGAGFDVVFNDKNKAFGSPMWAVVTFGNGQQSRVPLPRVPGTATQPAFFGITSSLEIAVISIRERRPISASFVIDNLTIGTAAAPLSAVPEAAGSACMGLGLLGLLGWLQRRGRLRLAPLG